VPEVFGLHMNAGITRDLHCTKQFLDSLLLVHGEGSAAQGEAWESETLVCELTEDILYGVSMLFKVCCVETAEF
jgi:dynein heavy chain